MTIASERKQPRILSVDIIHPIVDLLALDFDTENLALDVRRQRRLPRVLLQRAAQSAHRLSRIVSPRLFRTLKLMHALSSFTGFLAIIQSPWVRHRVQAVRYEY
jgi:hypothetical protein